MAQSSDRNFLNKVCICESVPVWLGIVRKEFVVYGRGARFRTKKGERENRRAVSLLLLRGGGDGDAPIRFPGSLS